MVSMTEIARYAGVSQTTVSRVLNQPDQVKKETYEKVMAAVTEWGYPVKAKEKTVPKMEATIIRLLVEIDEYSMLGDYLPGIFKTADKQGYLVAIHFISSAKKDELYDVLVSAGTAGTIVALKRIENSLIDKLNQSELPYVLLNTNHSKGKYSVGMNNIEAGFKAASYLLEHGHKRIAWIGGSLESSVNKDRFMGYIFALQAYNAKIRKKRLLIIDADKKSVSGALERLQALKRQPTAIVAASDDIAIRLMNLSLKAGWNVPKDFSIIGIGNAEMDRKADLGLSTIGFKDKKDKVGEEAVTLLIDLLNKRNALPQHILMDVSLVEGSTISRN